MVASLPAKLLLRPSLSPFVYIYFVLVYMPGTVRLAFTWPLLPLLPSRRVTGEL